MKGSDRKESSVARRQASVAQAFSTCKQLAGSTAAVYKPSVVYPNQLHCLTHKSSSNTLSLEDLCIIQVRAKDSYRKVLGTK